MHVWMDIAFIQAISAPIISPYYATIAVAKNRIFQFL